MQTYILIILSILLVVFVVCFYKTLMNPTLPYHSFRYRMKAWLLFWLGDIRRLDNFPWVTWATHGYKIDFKDARRASIISRPGDIGLHRDSGYLSNCGIPGAFKHAWITVDNNYCVEAVSDGVLCRDELYPLISDYAIILRPKGVKRAETDDAVNRAKSLVGCKYDANFNFDFDKANADLLAYTENLKTGEFLHAFSCTETVAFSWYNCKDKLRIFRTIYAGREAIAADDFLKMGFDIVWVSPSVTLEWAKKNGLHEEGLQKIKDYLNDDPKVRSEI